MGIREQRAETRNSDVQAQDVELGYIIPYVRLWVKHRNNKDLRLDHIFDCPCFDLGGGHKAGRRRREQLKAGEKLRTHCQ